MKRKQEGKDERNGCYSNSSGAICLFWSFYQQLPHHGGNPVPARLHGFLAVKTHTMYPTPFHASAITQTAIVRGGFQSLYKYISLGDPYHSYPRIGLPFQYH